MTAQKVSQAPAPHYCQNTHWKGGGERLINATTVPSFPNLTTS